MLYIGASIMKRYSSSKRMTVSSRALQMLFHGVNMERLDGTRALIWSSLDRASK